LAALNPGAVTPGNNIGNQPLNPGNQLANPNNSLTPGQQATTPNSSKTPLQNTRRTVYTAANPPSIHDTTPAPPRPPAPSWVEVNRQRKLSNWEDRLGDNDWDLSHHTALRGHGDDHVYKTWKEVADRSLNPKPGAWVPDISSMFQDGVVNRLVRENMAYNRMNIKNWVKTAGIGKKKNFYYEPTTGEITGFGILQGKTYFEPMPGVTIRFIKTQQGYHLDSYFPDIQPRP